MKFIQSIRIIIIFSLILSTNLTKAQVSSTGGISSGQSKYYIGGGIGLSFGSATYIYMAPELTYAITENLHAGFGVSYEYQSIRNYIPTRNISIYGGKVFARYYVLDDFFAHVEYERLYYRDNFINPEPQPLIGMDGMYAGVGYRQWTGGNSFFSIALLFNVMDDQIIFGINPFLRFGFSIGL